MPPPPFSGSNVVDAKEATKLTVGPPEDLCVRSQGPASGAKLQHKPATLPGSTSGSRWGRPPQKTLSRPALTSKPGTTVKPRPRPLPLQSSEGTSTPAIATELNKEKRAKEQGAPPAPRPVVGAGKKVTVAVAPTEKTEEANPPAPASSFLDDMPVEACLEYLTRPHRSWESATRIRELQKQRAENSSRAARRRSASNSLSSSMQFSASSSVGNMSAHSAPPAFGRFGTGSTRAESRGGIVPRARFGALPGAKPEPEGLMVGGTSVVVSGGQLPLRLQPPLSFGECRSATAGSVGFRPHGERCGGGPQGFSFSMK